MELGQPIDFRWLDASEPLLVEPAPRRRWLDPLPPLPVGQVPRRRWSELRRLPRSLRRPCAVLAPPSAWSNRAVAARRIPQPPPSASSPPQSSPPLVGPASAAAAARPDSSAAGRTSFGISFLLRGM
ncbi:hypothetical protein Scep_027400 [Stephania cephalantha]|uniref:Uncharacterized protein n=1 Tax=Stephania cephalantha TaxID=152367 RepID=A0AAP0HH80_9MAGN